MRFNKSFTRSIVAMSISFLFLIAVFARPALAQSANDASSGNSNRAVSKLSVSPMVLNYGVINLNTSKLTATRYFKIKNEGGLPMTVTVGAPTGTDAADYKIVFPPAVSPAGGTLTLPARITQHVSVEFTPIGRGNNETAHITITNISSGATKGKKSATVHLKGKATQRRATPTPTATATATSTATATATATKTATATATATKTATATATATATPTPTPTSTSATATATATATPTVTATATATATATSTSGTPTATPTSTPGPQAGDVLIAGGDTGGLLGNVVPLATSTVSTASAEIYEVLSDVFSVVGPLLNSREASATAVVLPNQKILFAGGSYCHPQTYPAGGLCGASFSGFQCDALQTAELYDEGTQTFTLAGTAFGENPAGKMTTARSGATANLIKNSSTGLDGKVLITGGSIGSTFLALSAPPPGCGPEVNGQFAQVAQNSAEIYDPATDTFTATGSIPGCAAGTIPPACVTGLPATCGGPQSPITSASESGTTVTITSASNPTGLIVGDGVTVSGYTGAGIAGYNGSFVVTGIGAGTFTYTAASGLSSTSATGAFAAADTAQCGLIDSAAQLLNDGEVLVTGGDYIVFLGQSSPQSFVFVPSSATPLSAAIAASTFTQTFPMNVARELPGITILPSGKVLVEGGITGEAAACVSTPTTPVDFITNSSAEIYNPTTFSWTLTPGSKLTPGAPGGMSVQRIATAELFTTGTDSGLVIVAGGVNSGTTNGGKPEVPNFGTCESTANISQTTQTATDLFDEFTGLFTATGALHQSRGGYGYGVIGAGPKAGDLVVVGGECATGSLASAAIGSTTAGALCGVAAKTDYYELFNPTSGTWSVGTALPASTPANSPQSAVLP